VTEIRIKTRPVGASAVVGRMGRPHLTSETGGELEVVTGASDAGFNPLDLLYSSLAACLVLSARIAASRLGLIHRFDEARAHVTGEKAGGEVSRVARFIATLEIAGDLTELQKQEIAHMAEDICTVSNTLRKSSQIELQTVPR
jgi:uncharacterized OsmC-like protein